MMDFVDYVLFPCAIVFGALVAVLSVAFGIGEVAGRYQCNSYERITGTSTTYNTLDTCYVETADGWQRWDEYKARIIASEGLSND